MRRIASSWGRGERGERREEREEKGHENER
jgi:hypothetical protein